MSKRATIFAGGLLISACLYSQIISPLWGQQKADADKAAAGSSPDQEKALDIRYAQAYVNLMKATLARYEESNRVAPNTIRPAVIQGIEDAVRKANEQLELAKSDEANDSQIYVSSAEAALRLAEDALRRAQAANTRTTKPFSDGEIARLKAQIELAKVRVEKSRHLATESPLSNIRYELELLREDVLELQIRVALLMTRN